MTAKRDTAVASGWNQHTGNSPKQAQLEKTVADIRQKFPNLEYIDYHYNPNYTEETFKAFWPIFIAILAVVGAVLALTSAGIFSVALQKCDYEFGLYEAVGLSRSRTLLKGVAEVLLINLISIFISALAILMTVYSINKLKIAWTSTREAIQLDWLKNYVCAYAQYSKS